MLKSIPQSIEAEQAVLGAILANNKVFDDVAEQINGEDFYNAYHTQVFNSISQEVKQNKAFDAITLSKSHNLDMATLIDYVQLTQSAKNAVPYAKMVKKASIQRQIISASHSIAEMASSNIESMELLIADSERELAQVSDKLTVTSSDNGIKILLNETLDHLKELMQRKDNIVGISTGINALDAQINGLKKGTMVIIAARPAMGKTTMAMGMVQAEAIKGGNPIVFSIEMPRMQLMIKLFSSYANIPMDVLMSPVKMRDNHWGSISNLIKEFQKTNLEIVENSSITTDQIRIECRKYQKKHGKVSLIMVDYLQLIRGHKPENRTQEISQISRDLKSIAKEFDCPMLVLSQLSREVEKRSDKRPMNSDLRESGQLEQDAEEIIFIYRDEVYTEGVNEGLAEVIVSKCRMGMTGRVITEFQGRYSRFIDTERVPTTEKPRASKSASERLKGDFF